MTDTAMPETAPTSTGTRVWVYSNYHCNLACNYCLTESGPNVARRQLSADRLLALAKEAADLGLSELGVTGGEPFLVPEMPDILAGMAEELPVLVLTNGTLFTPTRMARMPQLASTRHRVRIQVSLDSADADVNDAARGPDNFRRVVEAIPELVAMGLTVRVATTGDDLGSDDLERLCRLHRSLGVGDDEHVVRPVVRRGRGARVSRAVAAGVDELDPELTVTADGAFWSPFGPTVDGGVLDTDLLVTRTTTPLGFALDALERVASGRPPGNDTRLGIR